MRTLQRRLFGSHLRVMLVALLVLVVGAVLVGAIVELSGGRHFFRSGPRGDGGPFSLVVGLLAASVASGLVSWQMSRRFARPLEDIGAAARELAAGRYDVRVPGSDTVELDALANDVNKLAAELRVTEERRLRLIGDVAHELRNPLSTIEGTMEALLDGVVTPDEETFARIGREAARLRRLADDLSSLSAAAESGRLHVGPVDLEAVSRDVVGQLEPQAVAKGLELGLEVSTGPDLVASGDRDRLTQVLTNVIGNAVQYTDAGSVRVVLEMVGGGVDAGPGPLVRIEVVDSGRGLAAADLERIFDRFHRVDAQFSDGTGVGLAIARLIVEAHGGTIVARSAGLGRGTSVVIELPV